MTTADTLNSGRLRGFVPRSVEDLYLTRHMTALSYLRMVHPVGGYGCVRITAKLPVGKPDAKGKKKVVWREHRQSPARIRAGHPAVMRDIEELRFVSFATFPYRVEEKAGTEAPAPEQGKGKKGRVHPRATQANITSIGANWSDIDHYQVPAMRGMTTAQIVEVILGVCEDRRWPAPSYILSSGRGYLVVWLYDVQPKEILKRWRVVQRTIHRAFEAYGADATGLSTTKVYRFSGSWNSKAEASAQVVWPLYVVDICRGSFESLAEQVLAQSRAEAKAAAAKKLDRIAKAAAKRLAKKAAEPVPMVSETKSGNRPRVGGTTTWRTYWETMRADVNRLLAYRYGGRPMPEDSGRSSVALVCTAIEAFLAPAYALDGFVRDNADLWGLTEEEAMSCTSGIRSCARMAAEGIQRSYNGRMGDARYRYSPERVRSLLRITGGEMDNAKLRMLVDEEHAKAVAASRQARVRRARGAKCQADQRDRRRELGLEALRLRREEGLTRSQIAARLGENERYLDTCIADARTVERIGAITPAPELAPMPDASHVSSRGTARAREDEVEITYPQKAVALVEDEVGAYTSIRHGECTSFTETDARCVPTGPAGVIFSGGDDEGNFVRSPLGWREWTGSEWVPMEHLTVWLRRLEPGTFEEVEARLSRLPT